ncbi:MAG: YigZ family protein [Chitinophagaceae bacterium]|nr:YigZ family protein [Chitinophagaceae bacterium]HMN33257.1 YigZ family protein [Chitinophagaceae bacterium]
MDKNQFSYKTVAMKSEAKYVDRGSKFLAFVKNVNTQEDIKIFIKTLKEQHPKAVHHCYAYRLGIGKNNFRANDDGEPSDSAGKPILTQIDSYELTNVLIVVVRYFGGVLLGIPGLVQAYKSAAKMAILNNQIIEKQITKIYTLTFDYTILNEVMRIVKSSSCEILENNQSLFCELKIAIPISNLESILMRFQEFVQLKIDAE